MLQVILVDKLQDHLDMVTRIYGLLDDHEYCLPIYILLSRYYIERGYPDLGAGAAYKALLLSDAVQDSSDEIHAEACEGLRTVISQQPLPQRIALLRAELTTGLITHESTIQLSEEQDVEMDVWLKKHYLPLV